jgi:hypothetical protein
MPGIYMQERIASSQAAVISAEDTSHLLHNSSKHRVQAPNKV